MAWGAFYSNGILKLVLVSGNMDSKLTCSPNIFWKISFVLQEIGLFSNKTMPQFMCQCIQKRFFCDKNVVVMDWPALSPDLNPIENLWGTVARKV